MRAVLPRSVLATHKRSFQIHAANTMNAEKPIEKALQQYDISTIVSNATSK